MKNKRVLIVPIIVIIIVIAILIFLGYIVFKNILGATYGRKLNEQTIIETFNNQYSFFEQFVSDLKNDSEITFKKEIISYDIILKRGNETVKIYDNNENYNQYVNLIEILERLQIDFVEKKNNNVIFLINSTFHFGQYIVYMSDVESFQCEYVVTYQNHLFQNWYYIETK